MANVWLWKQGEIEVLRKAGFIVEIVGTNQLDNDLLKIYEGFRRDGIEAYAAIVTTPQVGLSKELREALKNDE